MSVEKLFEITTTNNEITQVIATEKEMEKNVEFYANGLMMIFRNREYKNKIMFNPVHIISIENLGDIND